MLGDGLKVAPWEPMGEIPCAMSDRDVGKLYSSLSLSKIHTYQRVNRLARDLLKCSAGAAGSRATTFREIQNEEQFDSNSGVGGGDGA